jgi:group II intron reverse transcriptase/maturase
VRNPDEKLGDRTQGRTYLPDHLIRVNEAAKRSRQVRFTALLHHVDDEALERAFRRLRRKAAPGVDGMTVETYEGRLTDNLRELCDRVHSGRYKPLPVRRTHIPKADGGRRPLGILALEDKIVQGAVAEVLSAIYEADFHDFSYGFRPGRSAHQALRTIHDAIISERVNWVFEADIRKFYDSIDHEWLMRMVAHRIADPRILRLIRQWLEVGVLENGVYAETVEGTPQGAGISPLLANIFLHYALDLWVRQWMRRAATGQMRLVRYADDFLLTFERRADADRVATALAERLAKFGLRLHEDKTRLIEFGRFAAPNRQQRGQGKPETFHFLGFTHVCGRKRLTGGFLVKRKSMSQRLRAKLQAVKETLLRQRHRPLPEQGTWLQGVVRGYFNYHAVPGNRAALETFRTQAVRYWRSALRHRSQRSRLAWMRFGKLADLWIPKPRILHPYPSARFYAKHPK